MESRNKEQLARFGIFIKGVVYALIGILCALAAFYMEGNMYGSNDALTFIASQTYGKIILGIIAIGLLTYVSWRFYQTFADHEEKGNDPKDITKRLSYFVSGLFYGFISYSAVEIIVDAQSNSVSKQSIITDLLQKEYGQFLINIIAMALAGIAYYQFQRAYSGKFKEKIKESRLKARKQKILLRSGEIGFIARGIIIAILSFLLFKAAWMYNAKNTDSASQAFDFIQNQCLAILLGIVALGLFAYAIFMFIQARYRKMNIQ